VKPTEKHREAVRLIARVRVERVEGERAARKARHDAALRGTRGALESLADAMLGVEPTPEQVASEAAAEAYLDAFADGLCEGEERAATRRAEQRWAALEAARGAEWAARLALALADEPSPVMESTGGDAAALARVLSRGRDPFARALRTAYEAGRADRPAMEQEEADAFARLDRAHIADLLEEIALLRVRSDKAERELAALKEKHDP
jgi:hypothetical protein